jgi:hypothetical protein
MPSHYVRHIPPLSAPYGEGYYLLLRGVDEGEYTQGGAIGTSGTAVKGRRSKRWLNHPVASAH